MNDNGEFGLTVGTRKLLNSPDMLGAPKRAFGEPSVIKDRMKQFVKYLQFEERNKTGELV